MKRQRNLSLFFIYLPSSINNTMKKHLTQYLNYLRYEKRVSEHTIISYQTDIEQFFQFLKKENSCTELDSIQPEQIRTWILSLIDHDISTRTINHKISALKSFYRYHLRMGNITHSPVTSVPTPKIEKRLPCFVDEQEMEHLFKAELFSNNYEGWRDRMIIELFYATGIRISELINLKFSSINLYDNTLKVLGKRNKERIIPFGNNLKKCYQSYVNFYSEKFGKSEENYYIFVTDKANKLYPKFVYTIVRKYLDMITTIDKRSPHVLRHTFATHLLNHGADINAIKEILGHSSLAATQVYTHNSIEKLKTIYQTAHPRA